MSEDPTLNAVDKQLNLPKEENDVSTNEPILVIPDKDFAIVPKEDDSESKLNSCQHSSVTKPEINSKDSHNRLENRTDIKSYGESSSQSGETRDYRKRSLEEAKFKIPNIPEKRKIERPREHIHFDRTWAGKRGGYDFM